MCQLKTYDIKQRNNRTKFKRTGKKKTKKMQVHKITLKPST